MEYDEMPRKADGQVAITLRLREDLRDRLAESAKAGDTSLNSEIVTRLSQSMSEQTLLGGDSTASALRALAAEIANVEQRTGKSWREDVRTYTAAKDVIARALSRFSPPIINQDKVSAASEQWESARSAVNGQIEYLKKVGAVERVTLSSYFASSVSRPNGMFGRPIVAAGSSSSESQSEKYRQINDALERYGYRMCIDLDAPLDSWPLVGADGSPMPDAEKVAVRAMLMGIPAYSEQEEVMARAWEAEYAPHHAEEKEGQKLADEIVGYKIPRGRLFGGLA